MTETIALLFLPVVLASLLLNLATKRQRDSWLRRHGPVYSPVVMGWKYLLEQPLGANRTGRRCPDPYCHAVTYGLSDRCGACGERRA